MPALDPPSQKLASDSLKARLRRRLATPVKFLEPLAPPGKTDCTQVWIAARRNDVGKGKIEAPQCGKCRSQLSRQLPERDLSVMVEPALSDR